MATKNDENETDNIENDKVSNDDDHIDKISNYDIAEENNVDDNKTETSKTKEVPKNDENTNKTSNYDVATKNDEKETDNIATVNEVKKVTAKEKEKDKYDPPKRKPTEIEERKMMRKII